MTDLPTVEFKVSATGMGTLSIDGKPVKMATGFDVRVRAGEMTKITVYLHGNIDGTAEGEVTRRTKLTDLIRESIATFKQFTPEQKRVHRNAQRKSWALGELMLSHPEMSRAEAERIVDSVLASGV